MHHWDYSDGGALGPSEWPKYFKTGDSQSPINIVVDHCSLQERSGPAGRLHEQLDRKLVLGARPGRRDHLDSVGNETGDSRHSEDERLDSRSPSASSRDSAQSGESNDGRARQWHHLHDIHHHRHLQRGASSQTQNTRYCGTNKKLFLGYPRYLNSVKLSNTGHGWQIDMPAELARHTLLTGPPLGDREYRLAQFHCHWGEDCEHGSEHRVNGQSFSAEIHFVHWNCSQYASIEEASKNKHGLAVLGVFVQALDGEQNRNKHLDKIIAGLERVRDRPHDSALVDDIRLDLKKLFPSNRWNYATYEGSLTTPPLSECVDWLVFLQPISCSSSQLEHFRRIRCPSGELTRNWRPVQPVNKRTVTIWTHHSDQAGSC